LNPVDTKNAIPDGSPHAADCNGHTVGLAPIALFVYNRPEHTRRTIERLRDNALASKSDLHIFSDAAKNENTSAAVEEVRKLIQSIDGFRSITILERHSNFGLAASVIDGVSQLCERYGQVVAVEDDLLTAPDFLTFMNSALDRYRSTSRVFSIGAFSFGVRAPQGYPSDAFFSYRSCSWGWATWRDRWVEVDWEVSDYRDFRSDRRRTGKFSRGGGDLVRMLARQMAGQLDSWAIRWAYTHCAHDAVALLPVESRVFNIGLDGSGTHCRRVPLTQGAMASETSTVYHWPDHVSPSPDFTDQIRKDHPGSLVGRLGKYLKRRFAPNE
jgi:Glycosyl transferase family 2